MTRKGGTVAIVGRELPILTNSITDVILKINKETLIVIKWLIFKRY